MPLYSVRSAMRDSRSGLQFWKPQDYGVGKLRSKPSGMVGYNESDGHASYWNANRSITYSLYELPPANNFATAPAPADNRPVPPRHQ
jgi:hypothetical protein